MKKIKKIAASLMALAITAAGMSSISANALYTSRSILNGKVTAAVSFNIRYSYGSTTTSYNKTIRRLTVSYDAYQNGWYKNGGQTIYGTGSAYAGLTGSTITSYHSSHSAYDGSRTDSTSFSF